MISLIKKIIIKSAKSNNFLFDKDIQIIQSSYEKFGDYSFNAIGMAKMNKFNSAYNFALKLADNIKNDYFTLKVVEPGFINFFLKDKLLIKNIEEILRKKNKYGQIKNKNIKSIVVDYSSPNIAKPMSVGHLRSTIIGQFICNIYRLRGYRVYGINHLGDWGTQFGKLIYAYKKWGNSLKSITVSEMLNLYIKFHKEAAVNPTIEDKAREEFKLLEKNKSKENIKIWNLFKKISIKEFDKIYQILNIGFTYPINKYPESFYDYKKYQKIEKILRDNQLVTKSQGAQIIDLGDKCPPVLLTKSDGATLYATRELAALKYRIDKFNPERIIYVIGNEQKLHLKQIKLIAQKLNFKTQIIHVGFGLVRLAEGKMSTREGRIILLEALINKAIEKAYFITKQKNKDLSEFEINKVAQAIGIGAIKYNDLSQNRNTDIVFNYDKMLSLKGNSSLYLQYTYARANKIITMSKGYKINLKENIKADKEEKSILRKLALFNDVLEKSAQNYNSNILTDYIFSLANIYNNFYQTHPVLKSSYDKKDLRLAITQSIAQIIKNSLEILGIEVIEKI